MAREPWDAIGDADPYFGVCANEAYRGRALSPEHEAEFYASGERHVAYVRDVFVQHFGAAPSGAGLDVGCGVGRLTTAMAAHCETVTGYDVAPSMLAVAREAADARGLADRLQFTSQLPGGPFDWALSYIVFQHIPPADGLALLDNVLARLAPGGFAALHFTVWRDEALAPRRGWRGLAGRARRAWAQRRALAGAASTDALVAMHDYDLGAVVKRFVEAGCADMVLRHADHGGHHGVEIFARRAR